MHSNTKWISLLNSEAKNTSKDEFGDFVCCFEFDIDNIASFIETNPVREKSGHQFKRKVP